MSNLHNMKSANKPKRKLKENAKGTNCSKQKARQVQETSKINIKYIFMAPKISVHTSLPCKSTSVFSSALRKSATCPWPNK